MKYFENDEGYEEYFISENYLEGKKEGITALVRARNDEAFIVNSIKSIIEHVDEVLVLLHVSKDNTKELIESNFDEKISIIEYPFECHSNKPDNSVQSPSYLYNWAMSQAEYKYIWKWEGNKIAFDWMGLCAREYYDHDFSYVTYSGIILVGEELKHKCDLISKVEIFRMCENAFFMTADDYMEGIAHPRGKKADVKGITHVQLTPEKESNVPYEGKYPEVMDVSG